MDIWWKYPAALVLGFLIQMFYLPGTSTNVFDGMVKIILMCLGSLIAYYIWWR